MVCARYHYTTQSLIGIWRRKLISPSAVALACVSVRKHVCVLPKGKREGGGKKDEAENFPLDILPAELLARLESDAARRHGSHLGSALAVNVSTQATLQRKVWSPRRVHRLQHVLIILSELGWREGCSWLTRNNDNQVLSIYLSVYIYIYLSITTHGS